MRLKYLFYRNLSWQLYPSWGLKYTHLPDPFGPSLNFLIIGPIQLRWWSKRVDE